MSPFSVSSAATTWRQTAWSSAAAAPGSQAVELLSVLEQRGDAAQAAERLLKIAILELDFEGLALIGVEPLKHLLLKLGDIG